MTQQDLATMLVMRGLPGDHTRAASLTAEALDIAERLGMRGVAAEARALRATCAGATSARLAAASDAANAFACEGEYWTVRYGGATYRLRDRAGFTHLVALLERPHEEIPALTLAAGPDAPSDMAGAGARAKLRGDWSADLGEVLDLRARAEYRERLRDLELEIDDAEQAHDLGRVERLRGEEERLREALGAALGLGGRARRSGSPAERARVRVTRALREAIDRIRALDDGLGEHLARSIRTGTFCCYAPQEPTSWEVVRGGA
jgi:hypothetical protein